MTSENNGKNVREKKRERECVEKFLKDLLKLRQFSGNSYYAPNAAQILRIEVKLILKNGVIQSIRNVFKANFKPILGSFQSEPI